MVCVFSFLDYEAIDGFKRRALVLCTEVSQFLYHDVIDCACEYLGILKGS